MSEFLHFGDVGTETGETGSRKVMWIAPNSVVILHTDVPNDPHMFPPIVTGLITYALNDTKWQITFEND